MVTYIMTEAENLLAELIWEKEPLGSGELVKLASQRLGWKKSTTYTVLRKICENDIFQNKGAVVTSKVSKEEYTRRKGERYLEENYNGSLPNFVAAFLKRKKLSKNDIEELVTLIEEYKD
ncbi:MAG: BlaI/MecI/CopY family transcriptional regulator [Lachnospiraceae bacterium]|nr:BlaI/MecI/CopY family transcriptional regulator [Lachnospiraceae bacterium]MDE6056060.1 BlaI/MecI/CopY family transcriptional regulator [Lachnospiraceae bacterium]MDE7202052.1 BlaI/MecI/CopY family transcriptional regulator [Lachnospiraceae bacterium]MDE7416426.1 BlaI/MecI/CopY family transcriptional regulator [Lachnospiraceae bacterium]